MFQVPVDILNGGEHARMDTIRLDPSTHSSDGRLPFHRAELFLSPSEVEQINSFFSSIESSFGKPLLVDVKEPPIIPSLYAQTPVSSGVSPLPARSTRNSMPVYTASSRVSGGGKVQGGKSARVSSGNAPMKADIQVKPEAKTIATPFAQPVPVSEMSAPGEVEVPMIPMNKAKIQQVIQEAFAELMVDPDYVCLQDENCPRGLAPPPSVSLSLIRERIESEAYADHFQFMNDLVSVSTYWLQGPPQPNPALPQYVAALKLIRLGTELIITTQVSRITNDDYYTGPDVQTAIKEEAKRDQAIARSSMGSTVPSPRQVHHARKVRRNDSSASISRKSSALASSELRSIEEQVSLLTKQVLGLQNRPSQSRQSAPVDSRPLSVDEIQKLEADLIKLNPDDIDHIVNHILKDEPSVRVNDESYELDVGALPPIRQRNLRRFVTRRLNTVDPSHETNKLKQILKADELAKASEEIAERLLAGIPAMSSKQAPEADEMSAEEEEAERQRQERDRQREEEARRLWRLAHGDDDDEDVDMEE